MENIKILYVEDQALIMRITNMMFDKIGVKPDCATNATDALKLAKQHRYDLILLDLGLSDLDGMQLAAQIRKHEQRYRIHQAKYMPLPLSI